MQRPKARTSSEWELPGFAREHQSVQQGVQHELPASVLRGVQHELSRDHNLEQSLLVLRGVQHELSRDQ